MIERLAELLGRKHLARDGAAGILFTAATQSSRDFCSGCDAGTQCETFKSKVLSCASAGLTLAASSKARQAFLITRLSLFSKPGFVGLGSLFNMLYNWSARSSRNWRDIYVSHVARICRC
jgi:hypothetical protein